ncbi:MAG: hypothetical protein KBC21_00835 [Candidatus Pacebacteria bacterium]|nr:hypothetical protein [Candidatus Paceibacterota bacterium]
MKKISHFLSPLLLGAFLFPLIANAEEATTTVATSTTSSSTIVVTKAQLFTSCSQDAIESRDTKLAQARGSYNTAMSNLLLERKNVEKAAVAIEDEKEKKTAIKESVEKYKTEVKTIQNTLTQSRKTIWQNFENDTRVCREFLEKTDEEKADEKAEKRAAKEIGKKEVSEAKEIRKEEKKEENETKSVKDSIFDSIKSLFSKEN